MAENSNKLKPGLERLDPRFQWELKRYCLALSGAAALCPEGILRMRTMVYLEMLLHALYQRNEEAICNTLDQLALLDATIPSALYELLREQSNPEISDAKWGERAFKGQKGARASRRDKLQAVQTLQAKLREV